MPARASNLKMKENENRMTAKIELREPGESHKSTVNYLAMRRNTRKTSPVNKSRKNSPKLTEPNQDPLKPNEISK